MVDVPKDTRPFTLIVAGHSMALSEAPSEQDGPVLYLEEALLTGELAWTDQGADVQFTDIEADV